jgi:CTP:molybdopterin cytidylyltransferase MocA
MQVAAIILAAGGSRRLGAPKQLLKVNGETLIERAVRLAREAGASSVIAVLGAYRQAIVASLHSSGATIAVNEKWERGIASSIQAGLRTVDADREDAAGVLLMSCDQPRLTATHLRSLIETFAAHPEPAIIASAYAGVQGVPAVFPRVAWPRLRELRGDQGARVLLSQPTWPVIAVPLEGGEVDIDLPEDLAYLR